MRSLYTIALLYIGVSVFAIIRGPPPMEYETRLDTPAYQASDYPYSAERWFLFNRQYCNQTEADVYLHHYPPPSGDPDTPVYVAACFALAGQLDDAKEVIDRLGAKRRMKVAATIYEVVDPVQVSHPSAAPLMELVLEYWPSHQLALYYAGMARLELGDDRVARRHLETFLEYHAESPALARQVRRALRSLDRR